MKFKNKTYNLQRYPNTGNRSLRPWSAADELLLSHAESIGLENKKIVLAHDTFGALAISLNEYKPHSIVNNNSQLKATKLNLDNNGLNSKELEYSNPLKVKPSNTDLAILKVPKSTDLFQLYLQQLHKISTGTTTVLCGFMTRNFTPKWVEIAEQYFTDVSQSKAAKKARLLILKSPKKETSPIPLFHTVKNELDLNIKQYAGVFSASKIDIATTVLLENIPSISDDDVVLDLACGNGVIGAFVRKQSPKSLLYVLDDNFLAISSAKLNLSKENTSYHWSDSIKACKEQKFDFIFCNPPFHFEYENTIEIALQLFGEAAKALKQNGTFMIVANTHLNYKIHLDKLFKNVSQLTQSGKYEVIKCKL